MSESKKEPIRYNRPLQRLVEMIRFHRFDVPERTFEYASKIDRSKLFWAEVKNKIDLWQSLCIIIIGDAGSGKSLCGLLIAREIARLSGTAFDIKKHVTAFTSDIALMISKSPPNTVFLKDEMTKNVGRGSRTMEWMLADLLKCYDEETEVLTKDGWKFFKNVTKDDEFATIDNGNLVYQKQTGIVATPYKGKMYRLKTRQLDIMVVPTHRMYVSLDKNKPVYEFKQAQEIKGRWAKYVRGGVNWEGREMKTLTFPKIKNKNGGGVIIPEKTLLMDSWLKFVGIYIAEGCRNHFESNGHYRVAITQTKPRIRSIIKRIVDDIGYGYFDNGKDMIISNRQLYEYLAKVGDGAPNKHIPNEFMNLSKRQLGILFDHMMLGDGHIDKHGIKYYGTSSVKLRDQVQEIALKLGFSSTYNPKGNGHVGDTSMIRNRVITQRHKAWVVVITPNNEPKVFPQTHHIEEYVDYDGMVYCVSVPNETLFVRRGGRTVFCGNTVMRYNQIHFVGIGVELTSEIPKSVVSYLLLTKSRDPDPEDPRKTRRINLEIWLRTGASTDLGDYIPIGRLIINVEKDDDEFVQSYLEHIKRPVVLAYQKEMGAPGLASQGKIRDAVESGIPLSEILAQDDFIKPVLEEIKDSKEAIRKELGEASQEIDTEIERVEKKKKE